MRCDKCGRDFPAGNAQCPYCQAPVHYGGNTTIYDNALQSRLSLGDLFSGTFKPHSVYSSLKMFMSGTSLTTPPPDRMLVDWERPWLYARFIIAGLIFAFLGNMSSYGIFAFFSLCSLIMPLSILIFYWEINIPRDIPIHKVLMLFFMGGMLSIFFLPFVGHDAIGHEGIPAYFAPFTEEPAKILATAVCILIINPRYIFGGMLIGAAVGAGFASFENIGYVFRSPDHLDTLIIRNILAIGGHVSWAAIEGGALVAVKGNERLSLKHFYHPGFIVFVISTMAMHFAWNSDKALIPYVVPVFGEFVKNNLHPATKEAFIASVIGIWNWFLRLKTFILCIAAAWVSSILIKKAILQVLEVVDHVPQQAIATLTSMAGPLGNNVFQITRRLTIGRDPACDIVFPANAPGISRRHCAIESRADGVYLMDTGSSTGVFSAVGQRAPANQWIKVRGSFYLGSPNVMFSVGDLGQNPAPSLQAPQQSPQQKPVQPVNKSVPTLAALSGPLSGQVFPLNQRLTIGRDPSVCNVVLPPNTPGVSRRHCILESRPDGVYLMDPGSSHGVFSASGQRAPVNQWIKIRGKFYLGSQAVMFSVS